MVESPHVTALKQEEARCLGKLDKLARRKVLESPGKTYTVAMAEACREFRVTYMHYTETREQLAQMGVRPMSLPGLKLSKG